MLIYIKIFGSGVKISARLRSRSAIFGKIRFDSVDFSQLADRALPRARCTIHYEVLQLQRANLAQPDTLSLSLYLPPYTTTFTIPYSVSRSRNLPPERLDSASTATATATDHLLLLLLLLFVLYYRAYETTTTITTTTYDTFIIAFIHRHGYNRGRT